MALREYTKVVFANTLMDMMKNIPLEKIRVGDLCARCGAQRQSFYYHFRDKYDLVAWIFTQDYDAALFETGGQYLKEHAIAILRRMKKREAFYRKAFSDRSQNAIMQYLLDYFTLLGENAVRTELGEEALDTDAKYAIRGHSFACVGHTLEWLEGRTDYTPEEFARLQYLNMPRILKQAYKIDNM